MSFDFEDDFKNLIGVTLPSGFKCGSLFINDHNYERSDPMVLSISESSFDKLIIGVWNDAFGLLIDGLTLCEYLAQKSKQRYPKLYRDFLALRLSGNDGHEKNSVGKEITVLEIK